MPISSVLEAAQAGTDTIFVHWGTMAWAAKALLYSVTQKERRVEILCFPLLRKSDKRTPAPSPAF